MKKCIGGHKSWTPCQTSQNKCHAQLLFIKFMNINFYLNILTTALYTVRSVRFVYYKWETRRSRSIRKEMSGKNGAVVTKSYTARDDIKLNMHEDSKIRVFAFDKWVFVRMILKFIAFFWQKWKSIAKLRQYAPYL